MTPASRRNRHLAGSPDPASFYNRRKAVRKLYKIRRLGRSLALNPLENLKDLDGTRFAPPICVVGVVPLDEGLRQSILAHVTDAIRTSVGSRDLHIAADTRLSEDLALDSLDVVEVTMTLEQTFDVEFPQEAIRQFSVVGDLVAYLSCRYFRDVDELPFHEVAWSVPRERAPAGPAEPSESFRWRE